MNTIFFANNAKGGKGEGAGGVPSLVKGHAVGYEARPDANKNTNHHIISGNNYDS